MRTVNYIDPGTGVAIAGSLWTALFAFLSAVSALLLKIFWTPIKKLFSRKKENTPLSEQRVSQAAGEEARQEIGQETAQQDAQEEPKN